MQKDNNIPSIRTQAKRLSRKELLVLVEQAYVAGELQGHRNANCLYMHARYELSPVDAFLIWKKDQSKQLNILK
tara:strand:- start:136 stop:357 length:222 start_codon:yes stop_codon:yes gene_type:complete